MIRFLKVSSGSVTTPAASKVTLFVDSTSGTAKLKDESGNVKDVSVTECLMIAASDETTAITTGTGKVTFRMPFAMTLTAVRASLTTASSSGIPTVDINEGGVSILSTKITIDNTETTSTTAAAPPVRRPTPGPWDG